MPVPSLRPDIKCASPGAGGVGAAADLPGPSGSLLQSSICVPSSTTLFGGIWKYSQALTALRVSFSRQTNATFGEPEVRFSAVGPAIVMPMIIGYKKARELLYLGDQIDAKTALDLGMVNRIVPLAELREVSVKFAKRLSLISPEALYATKRAVNRVADAAGFRTALYAGLDVVGPLYATTTELGARFRQIATTEGVPAAVRWRSAQFKE